MQGFTIPYNPPMQQRMRLGFLDGMRGAAAFYVLLLHIHMEWEWKLVNRDGVIGWGGDPVHPILQHLMGVVAYGHFAVAIFIGLSGFCLMMPVARSANGEITGGLKKYVARRAKRILPPYYAALLFSLLAIALIPMLHQPRGTRWDVVLPAFTPGVLISHLLVLHNLSPAWIDKINPPMWSVPPEWIIYFIFALMLLPIWRRFGLLAVNLFACAVGMLPHFLMHGRIDFATPWYLAVFTFGLTAAVIRFSPQPTAIWMRERIPWGGVAVLLWVGCAVLFALREKWALSRTYATDPLVGLSTGASILYLAQFSASNRSSCPLILRFFESRALVGLGTFSYSLYLVHYPLLPLIHAALRSFGIPPTPRMIALLILGVIIPLGVAYLFHLAFERPFMTGHPKSLQKAATSAVLEPAI